MNQTLLIELLTEELPPKALAKLGAAFAASLVNGLKTRAFVDALGRLNQAVAGACERVTLMAAGLPLTLKAPR